MGVGPSTRPPGSNHGRQAEGSGEDLSVDHRCPRVVRSSNTKYGRVWSLHVAFHGGSHGSMIGRRSGSRGDARSAERQICEWKDALHGHRGVRFGEASRRIQDLFGCVGGAVDGVGVSLLRFRLMRSRWSATFRDTWSR